MVFFMHAVIMAERSFIVKRIYNL